VDKLAYHLDAFTTKITKHTGILMMKIPNFVPFESFVVYASLR